MSTWIHGSSKGTKSSLLGGKSRRKIIMDVAKEQTYEECRQKISHLDVKPQNIILDKYFNWKISDFKLSKVIDKDQSLIVTIMRGTQLFGSTTKWTTTTNGSVLLYLLSPFCCFHLFHCLCTLLQQCPISISISNGQVIYFLDQ
ncbi:hypothetical protein HYC85_015144 [Camellia sinensis]|uniref:Protein kinase domain-containing protein n=1 Tax=Camellia sinensis TaxID=4442 RepID=A0A7J7H9J0_CAMSI|nr:hypothetical protein HYC85_015144 [Camellia sinensis]